MEASALHAAIILTGRGGSGTRLLSQLAEQTGVFIGNGVNKSGDSVEWVDLIYRMVVEAGGGHDLPSGSRYREEIRARARQILEGAAPRVLPSWGLKLPETMLVLPLLMDAFPSAKVIHLTRHPISSSLRRTHQTSRLGNAVGAVTLPAAYRYSKRDVARIATDEPYLHNACSWNFQVTRVVRYGREVLGRERYLEIAYEDVCAEPARILAQVRCYLGFADERGGSIPVDLSRAGTWDPHDQRIETVWDVCGETASLLGYTILPHRPLV